MAKKIESLRARGALLDVQEAADYLGVTERWIRRPRPVGSSSWGSSCFRSWPRS
jgi:hypothetical protein